MAAKPRPDIPQILRVLPAKALALLTGFRNPIAVVLVTLFPVGLTPRASTDRQFAWLFSCAVSAGVVFLYLSERFRRKQPGHCLRCAYDLTGNTSGVCPECGCAAAAEGQVSEIRSILEWQ